MACECGERSERARKASANAPRLKLRPVGRMPHAKWNGHDARRTKARQQRNSVCCNANKRLRGRRGGTHTAGAVVHASWYSGRATCRRLSCGAVLLGQHGAQQRVRGGRARQRGRHARHGRRLRLGGGHSRAQHAQRVVQRRVQRAGIQVLGHAAHRARPVVVADQQDAAGRRGASSARPRGRGAARHARARRTCW